MATMVFLMVFIGGVTRLTDSGLSMVDWKPIMGTIPPLNEQQWQSAFDQYKNYPEYQKINQHMDMEGFKRIYFWEYFHRLFGRLIGLVFFFPFIYFLIKKRLQPSQIKKYSIAFILGGMQGILGWYMVKSGLVNRPDVSHFRLAAHLSLAFTIIAYIYWLLLELKFTGRKISFNWAKSGTLLSVLFFGVLILQLIYGAFVAGLDAGLTHNTFPKMGREWIPSSLLMLAPGYLNFLENPVALQFVHRVLGILLLVIGGVLFFNLRKKGNYQQKKSALMMGLVLLVQVVLGISTLIYYVPISLASMHQLGACLLLLTTIRILFFNFTAELDKA